MTTGSADGRKRPMLRSVPAPQHMYQRQADGRKRPTLRSVPAPQYMYQRQAKATVPKLKTSSKEETSKKQKLKRPATSDLAQNQHRQPLPAASYAKKNTESTGQPTPRRPMLRSVPAPKSAYQHLSKPGANIPNVNKEEKVTPKQSASRPSLLSDLPSNRMPHRKSGATVNNSKRTSQSEISRLARPLLRSFAVSEKVHDRLSQIRSNVKAEKKKQTKLAEAMKGPNDRTDNDEVDQSPRVRDNENLGRVLPASKLQASAKCRKVDVGGGVKKEAKTKINVQHPSKKTTRVTPSKNIRNQMNTTGLPPPTLRRTSPRDPKRVVRNQMNTTGLPPPTLRRTSPRDPKRVVRNQMNTTGLPPPTLRRTSPRDRNQMNTTCPFPPTLRQTSQREPKRDEDIDSTVRRTGVRKLQPTLRTNKSQPALGIKKSRQIQRPGIKVINRVAKPSAKKENGSCIRSVSPGAAKPSAPEKQGESSSSSYDSSSEDSESDSSDSSASYTSENSDSENPTTGGVERSKVNAPVKGKKAPDSRPIVTNSSNVKSEAPKRSIPARNGRRIATRASAPVLGMISRRSGIKRASVGEDDTTGEVLQGNSDGTPPAKKQKKQGEIENRGVFFSMSYADQLAALGQDVSAGGCPIKENPSPHDDSE